MATLVDLDESLARAKGLKLEEMDAEEIQNEIDLLDESIDRSSSEGLRFTRAVRRLQVLCQKADRLPTSCFIPENIKLERDEPYSTSNFSDVYCGLIGERRVAVKALRVHVDSRTKVFKAFYGEAIMWKFLRHPNLVRFLGVSTTMAVCLVSEWMPKGTVTAYLLAHPEADRIIMIRYIVEGLKYMHSLGVVHGDLKATNILINEHGKACLVDFGLAKALQNSASTTGTSALMGTLRWMAPELLLSSDADGGAPTFASDVYALAMVFYEVFTCLIPFHELPNDAAVMWRVVAGDRPERPPEATVLGLTDTMWLLLEKCWVPEPKQRPTVDFVDNSISGSYDGSDYDTALKWPTDSLEALEQWHTSILPSATASDLAFLDEGIQRKKESLALQDIDYPERLHMTWILSAALSLRFELTNDLVSLTDGIQLGQEALELCPVEHPDRLYVLQNLGKALHLRHEFTGDMDSLYQSASLMTESLVLCPLDHAERAHLLRRLGAVFSSQFEWNGDLDSIDVSIFLVQEALCLCPLGHPDRPQMLQSLGVALAKRGQAFNDMESINESLERMQEGLMLSPPQDPVRGPILNQLSIVLVQQFERLNIIDYLWRAMMHLTDLATLATSPATAQLRRVVERLASILNLISRQGDRLGTLFIGLSVTSEAAIQLLHRVANVGVEPSRLLEELACSADLGAALVAVALGLNDSKKAVEVLEEVRAVFWSQALRLRTPLDDLPPDDANRLRKLFNVLERGTSSHSTAKGGTSEISQLRRASEQAERLIQTIRQRPGFDRFLLSLPFSHLAPVAEKGPVIILLVLDPVCEAIILQDACSAPRRVNLPGVSAVNLAQLSLNIRDGYLRGGLETNAGKLRAMRKAKRFDDGATVLATIWKRIVEPIINALGIPQKSGRNRTRIQWCPTGSFTSLPLHAACAETTELGCNSFCVSSYTPTLTALLNARRHLRPVALVGAKALLVAEASSPGHPHLEKAVEEIEEVARILEPLECVFIGTGPSGSQVQEVCEQLSRASLVHFACHGTQNLRDPLQSGFGLRDGPLTISDIMRLNIQEGFLAFLSACETAAGDTKQPDQVVHMAAAMLFAGFRSVIASMWNMHDSDAPIVAAAFYEELIKDEIFDPDTIPYALDDAIQSLRSTGAPPNRWAPFIHMGA